MSSRLSVGPMLSLRLVVRTFSELCITVGAVIVLFVAYVLLWTGVKAADAAEGEIETLHSRWAQEPTALSPGPSSSPSPAPYRDGKPFATLHIPRFGTGWEWPVLENTEARTLQKGLGHYSGTARPGRPATSRWPGTAGRTETPSRTSPCCAPGTR